MKSHNQEWAYQRRATEERHYETVCEGGVPLYLYLCFWVIGRFGATASYLRLVDCLLSPSY